MKFRDSILYDIAMILIGVAVAAVAWMMVIDRSAPCGCALIEPKTPAAEEPSPDVDFGPPKKGVVR